MANCWLCKVLFVWKYADSTEIPKKEEYKNELYKLYAKGKYQGSFFKILSLALSILYFVLENNDSILVLSLGITVVVLLLIESCRIVLLPRCIDNEINNKCVQEMQE